MRSPLQQQAASASGQSLGHRLGLLPERLSHPRRLDHFRLHVVAQDPPTHLQCVGHVQCQLEPPVRQVAELLARVPEALADVPRELLREDHLHSDEVAADDAERTGQVLLGVEARGQREPEAQDVQAANAFHREDANRAPQVTVADEVELKGFVRWRAKTSPSRFAAWRISG